MIYIILHVVRPASAIYRGDNFLKVTFCVNIIKHGNQKLLNRCFIIIPCYEMEGFCQVYTFET